MTKLFIIPTVFLFSFVASALDLGFRYKDGKCVNDKGETGYNPSSYFGQCGDYSNVVLNRFNLDGVDFSGSKFNNADLQVTTFNQTILIGVNFQAANLNGVEFDKAKIYDSDFSGAALKNVKLATADIQRDNFDKTDLSEAKLSYVTFDRCQFNMAMFLKAELDNTQFLAGVLNGANFSGANLEAASLQGSSLENAVFSKANLRQADLSEIKGRAAVFGGATMTNANLTKAHLEDSDLRSANLTDAKTDGTELTGARFNRSTTLPFNQETALAKGMILKNSHILSWIAHADPETDWPNTLAALKKREDSLDLETDSSTDVASLKGKLMNADIFLIPDIVDGYDQKFVKDLGPVLKGFAEGGGIIVALADYNNFFKDTGLFPASECDGFGAESGDLPVAMPSHPLAKGLGATVKGVENVFACDSSADSDVDMVVGAPGSSYVMSKKIGAGFAVMIGYDFFKYNDDAEILLHNAIGLGE